MDIDSHLTKMYLNPEIFREYDIRGLAETNLGTETVYLLGLALANYFNQNGHNQALIGRDNRLSSKRIRNDLISGMTAGNCTVFDLGTVITPTFYYALHHLGVDKGAIITASHNPPEYNGLKVACGPGTLYGEKIQELRLLAEAIATKPDTLKINANQTTTTKVDITDTYLNMLTSKISLGPRHLKVAIDCGNGTASLFAVSFLESIGCEAIPLFCESDGRFPNHEPDPVKSNNLSTLQQTVIREKADVGIAYDGDGDRLGVVDDHGQIIWGDQLMILFWREILPKHPGATALIEVKCSQALVDEVIRLGGKPEFCKTGHSLIKAKMREVDAIFTGEMSGHMFFADEYYGYDDALYASGRLLRILSNTDQKLSKLLLDTPKYFSTAETRVPCNDRDKFDVVKALVKKFKNEYKVIDVDGARVLFPNGWGLVRCSNTQPVIVARCEGKTPEALSKICAVIKDALMSFPQVSNFEWEQ